MARLLLWPLPLALLGCSLDRGVPLLLRDHLAADGPVHLVEGGRAPALELPPGLRVELAGEARFPSELAGGDRNQGLLFRLAVKNGTGRAFALRWDRFAVRDEEGSQMRLIDIMDRKGRPTSLQELAAGQAGSWLLRFERPLGQPFRHNLELTLHWAFRLGDRDQAVASRFRAEQILGS